MERKKNEYLPRFDEATGVEERQGKGDDDA